MSAADQYDQHPAAEEFRLSTSPTSRSQDFNACGKFCGLLSAVF
jgi:hypothetical protein